MGDRNRSRRRPPRGGDSGYEGPTTEEEFPAAGEEVDTLDGEGPIAQELARRGLQEVPGDEDEAEQWDEPADGGGDALVFDDEGTAEANGGETFVGELPLEDEADPAETAEKTEILSVADVGHDEYPVLTIETADGATSDVDVVKDVFGLGRAPDSDVVIPDSLVSRNHTVIERRDDGWYLVDQNSGNGTFLNDERIREELLYDGDVIQIGDAFITFTAPGGAADQAPRLDATQMLPAADVMGAPPGGTSVTGTLAGGPAKKRKKLLIITALVVMLLGALVVVKFVVLKPKPQGPTKAQIMAKKRAEAEVMARKDFEKVKDLVKQEKWTEAKPMIADIAAFLEDDKTVQEYRAQIEKEATAAELLSQAQASMEQKKYEEAVAALSKMPANSLQQAEADRLKKTLDESRLEGQLEQAGTALTEKRFDDALAVADEVLRAFPDNEAAGEIKHQAEEAKIKVDRPPTHRRKRRKKIRKPPPKPKPKYLLVGKALDLYRNEKVDDALSQASGAGVSAEGVKTLRRFQSFYKQGMELSRNVGQSAKATKFLTKALSLDKKLSGGKGKVTSNLRKKLAKVYFLQGVDAHTRKKYPLAYTSFTQAKKYNPGLDQAAKRLQNLEIEAKKLFETAYVIKGSSPEKAVSHCKTVMGMVKKSNIYYGKCKKLIGKIRGPLGSTSDGAGDGF